MPFLIPITGRLVDPIGSGITGAAVWFTSKSTTRGPENVPQTADAYFTTDTHGYYSTAVATGWYKIYLQENGALEPTKIGVATVSGTDTLDLGTLIDNSIPPPTQLQAISNVDPSGLGNGSLLVYNASRQKWVTTVSSGNFVNNQALAALSGVYNAGYAAFPTMTGNFAPAAPTYRYLWTGAANTTGIATLPSAASYAGQQFTLKNVSAWGSNAVLIASGNIDFLGNYYMYPGAAATVLSDSRGWMLLATAFSIQIGP